MIKTFHRLFFCKSDEEYKALDAYFRALGFAIGESWDGRRSKGIKFEAPESGVEIGMGEGFPDADLVIEVDNADTVYQYAKEHSFEVVEQIADHDWGARMFTVALPQSLGHLAVFSYNEDWRHKSTEAELNGAGMKFALVVSRFNSFITERLLSGALIALKQVGVKREHIEIMRVPGAFEIPGAARTLAETGKYSALITLGCLLRGDTLHYEVIANEVTRGIGQAVQETGVPIGFGVLTCDTLEQAIDRAGLKAGNKGSEAALAAVEMAALKKKTGRKSRKQARSAPAQ
ncbi:MAG TPA: 6,7-dimethyl-8-ribityllumazine synthase [Terriglobales bacterium]|nr:6,7-dimethyl-8-ribityllumazine synthase [Terriglobales bacterium]